MIFNAQIEQKLQIPTPFFAKCMVVADHNVLHAHLATKYVCHKILWFNGSELRSKLGHHQVMQIAILQQSDLFFDARQQLNRRLSLAVEDHLRVRLKGHQDRKRIAFLRSLVEFFRLSCHGLDGPHQKCPCGSLWPLMVESHRSQFTCIDYGLFPAIG
jgi:hypothetical protein